MNVILKPDDPCPCCGQPIKTSDPDRLLVLSRLAEQARDKPAPEAAPRLTGRGAQEKQAVLEAIEAFRQARGPGAMAELARLSRVEEGTLRDMVMREKVPLAAWRAVGKALKEGAA